MIQSVLNYTYGIGLFSDISLDTQGMTSYSGNITGSRFQYFQPTACENYVYTGLSKCKTSCIA